MTIDSNLGKVDEVMTALYDIHDPEIGMSIVDLDLIKAVDLGEDGQPTEIKMVLTTPFCPWAGELIQTVGRRKEAVVRVRLVPGTGQYKLNGRTLEEYFPNKVHQQAINEPFVTLEKAEQYDVIARLHGGGTSVWAVTAEPAPFAVLSTAVLSLILRPEWLFGSPAS